MAKNNVTGAFHKNLEYIFEQSLTIPDNQRPYVWKKENAQDFWEDIQECFKKNSSLFLGTFIFYKESDDSPMQIVDGQQRITSIHLFLIAFRKVIQKKIFKGLLKGEALDIPGLIRQHLGKDGESSFTPSKQILQIYNLMIKTDFNGSFEDEDFINEYTINKDDSVNEKTRKRQINLQLNAIKSNYQYFFNNIDGIKPDDLYEFYGSVRNISYCAIETKEVSDAFDIFERTNNRGTPLHIADLLKNHLFKTDHELSVDKNLSTRWDKLLQEKNKKTPMIASKCKRWITTFHLTDHKFSRNDKQIIRDLKSRASANLNPFLNRLETYSNFFKLIDKKSSKYFSDEYQNSKQIINCFNLPEFEEQRMMKIHWAFDGLRTYNLKQMNPAIFCLFEKYSELNCHDEKNSNGKRIHIDLIPDFMRNIESWHFIMTYIIGIQANEFETLYHDLPYKIRSARDVNDLKNTIDDFFKKLYKLSEKLNKYDDNLDTTDFVREFKRLTYNENKSKCTYILKRMTVREPARKDDRIYLSPLATRTIIDDTSMDLDHWLAQKHKNKLKDHNKIHSIGNLLWVPKVLNSNKKKFGFGEKEPDEKIKMVQNEEFQEIKNAPLTLKRFVQKYHTNSVFWGVEEIEKRAEDLADDARGNVWLFKQRITSTQT